ncbi:hypothetical protein [Butyrivibrio proteoclasticus]|uniref:hypothetical protein n=1 Tax=Butyrivibrio proteoclasticus TaxID=43305 RepID=UPI00047E63C8|nr:hypothetical protein [Butyrivibrio proteoclasticus]
MDYEQIVEMLETLGLPIAYDHFVEGEAPALPYIVFYTPKTRNFPADSIVYKKIYELDIELYVEKKDPALEKRVEDLFDSYGLFYNKTETYISSEKMYEVLYEMEVM